MRKFSKLIYELLSFNIYKQIKNFSFDCQFDIELSINIIIIIIIFWERIYKEGPCTQQHVSQGNQMIFIFFFT